MNQKIPSWAIVAAAGLVIVIVLFFVIKKVSGPQLPSNYDPNAPVGTQISPPAGFEMKKEPAPPAPPAGVSTTPPGPGTPGPSAAPSPN